MAKQANEPVLVKTVRDVRYDEASQILTISSGTLEFDDDGRLRKFNPGTAPLQIKIKGKVVPSYE